MGLHVQELFLSSIRKQKLMVFIAQEFVFLWLVDVAWRFCEATRQPSSTGLKMFYWAIYRDCMYKNWSFEGNDSQPVEKK